MAEPHPHEPKWKSEFSMGQYHFERYNRLCMTLNELMIRVRQMDRDSVSYLMPAYSVMKEIYNTLLYPPMLKDVRTKYNSQFNKSLKEIMKAQNYIKGSSSRIYIESHNLLEQLQMDMFETAQFMGLGIVVVRDYTEKERLAKALKLKEE